MTQADKDLLLKDLCARLPYEVKMINTEPYSDNHNPILTLSHISEDSAIGCRAGKGFMTTSLGSIKPYLFPLSSMTEAQKQEFLSVAGYERRGEDCGRHTETYYYDMVGHENTLHPNCDAIDWLNAHHFDYRGLITMGLALDATGLNIY